MSRAADANWRKVRRSNDRHARDWRGNRHQIPPCFYAAPATTIIPRPVDPYPIPRRRAWRTAPIRTAGTAIPSACGPALARKRPRIFRGRRLGSLAAIPCNPNPHRSLGVIAVDGRGIVAEHVGFVGAFDHVRIRRTSAVRPSISAGPGHLLVTSSVNTSSSSVHSRPATASAYRLNSSRSRRGPTRRPSFPSPPRHAHAADLLVRYRRRPEREPRANRPRHPALGLVRASPCTLR